MADSWIRFWDRPHSIYVNERHLAVHCRHIADEIASVLPRRADLRVLDYGCGEALSADRVAQVCERLYMYDAAPSVRAHVAERFARVPNITVLDEAGLAALPEHSVDVVVFFSVLQYMAKSEVPDLLARWQRLLKPQGQLILADVIPPEAGMVDDIKSLLLTAWRYGFLLAALQGLAATLFSDYRRLRHELGFSIYSDQEIRAVLEAAGFRVERLSHNLGFHPVRRTYVAQAPA